MHHVHMLLTSSTSSAVAARGGIGRCGRTAALGIFFVTCDTFLSSWSVARGNEAPRP
nr:MAG TPA: hypothetical protein [Caudoviricetes sp.]